MRYDLGAGYFTGQGQQALVLVAGVLGVIVAIIVHPIKARGEGVSALLEQDAIKLDGPVFHGLPQQVVQGFMGGIESELWAHWVPGLDAQIITARPTRQRGF